MNKTELLSTVAKEAKVKEAKIKKADVEVVVEALLATIMSEVAKGEKIQITGFGSFERRERGERAIKNPRTGEEMQVAPSKAPAFSAGRVFKATVNPPAPKPKDTKKTKRKK